MSPLVLFRPPGADHFSSSIHVHRAGVSVVGCALAIAALVLVTAPGSRDDSCVDAVGGISFSYQTWLVSEAQCLDDAERSLHCVQPRERLAQGQSLRACTI